MAEAPSVERTLTPSSAAEILTEIIEVASQSYNLGLQLHLPPAVVEDIHESYSNPRDRLTYVLFRFLEQSEPRPTWRVIIDALRSRSVNMPRLAKILEDNHPATSAELVEPELKPYLLSNVELTGIKIGAGAYGSVEEVVIPVDAAAKYIHNQHAKTSKQLQEEYKLMSTLHHPNIVQFLGVCLFPHKSLPALVMERLLISIHDLLAPETQYSPGASNPLSFFTMDLKCSVLQDVANGLAYLHEQPSPIIHRDLSARNVLINSKMVAKISDLGMARILHEADAMTAAPGTIIYMPPEAMEGLPTDNRRSKYDAKIDIFSFGVLTIFVIGENIPLHPQAPTFTDDETGLLVARTELQRRSEYMQHVNDKLRACGQLRDDHPLIRLIEQCLHNNPHKRPNIREVLHLLEKARAGIRDGAGESNKRELVQAIKKQHKKQNLEHVIQDLVVENVDLQSRVQAKDKEIAQKEEQLKIMEEQLITLQARLKERDVVRRGATKRRQTLPQQMRQMEDDDELDELPRLDTNLNSLSPLPMHMEPIPSQNIQPMSSVPMHMEPIPVQSMSSVPMHMEPIPVQSMSSVPMHMEPIPVQPMSSVSTIAPSSSGSYLRLSPPAPPRELHPEPVEMCKGGSMERMRIKEHDEELYDEELDELPRLDTNLDLNHSNHELVRRTLSLPTQPIASLASSLDMLTVSNGPPPLPPRGLKAPPQHAPLKCLPDSEPIRMTSLPPLPAQPRAPSPSPPLTPPHSMIGMRRSTGSRNRNKVQLTVECYNKKKAPYELIKGFTTTDHQFAYFTDGTDSVYSYEWNTEQWNELPSLPYCSSALVIIDGTLTTVGGYGSGYTNKLFTLRQRQWVEEYPPMNTARYSPAVVSRMSSGGDYIIVIGGCGSSGLTVAVELFQVKTRSWYVLTNIPKPLTNPSATICGNQLHVIGYNANGYTCSTENLPFSDEPITSQSIPHFISWTPLPRLPVTQSTAATLYEKLVIIGGMQRKVSTPTANSIHQLVDGRWVEIGSMSSHREMCLVVNPSPDRIMIVGGRGARDSVEECVVV